MVRKVAIIGVVVGLALLLSVVGLLRMSTPTVTVGSGPVTLVQSGLVVHTFAGVGAGTVSPVTLPVASQAGTALIAIVGSLSSLGPWAVGAFPTGWVKLPLSVQASDRDLEVWVLLNNPGGITSISFTGASGPFGWLTQMSEWANVSAISGSVMEASGSATANAGSTLTLATAGNVLTGGDIAIAVWMQAMAAPSTVTFTTPPGFTRLSDSGAENYIQHFDAEYQLNPVTGAPLAAVLTSNGVTVVAAGLILALKAATPRLEQTAYLAYDSLTVKQNTFDFGLMLGGKLMLEDGSGFYLLEDGSGDYLLDTYVPQLGDPVTVTNPTWSGRVVSVRQTDVLDRVSNYQYVRVAATNTTAAPGGTAPGDLSDTAVGGYYLLEDSSGDYQLEDASGRYVLEGTAFIYRNLSIQKSQNQDGTVTTYGRLETFEGGYAAGMSVNLTSTNFGITAQAYTITNVTTTFVGANPPTPLYLIEFGDAYQTLQKAGGGVLTQQSSTAVIQQGAAVPAGRLGFATATTDQAGLGAAETDLTGLSVTVTVGSGRRVNIRGFVRVGQNTSAAISTCAIVELGVDLTATPLTIVAGGQGTHMPEIPLTPTAGVHTYKLTLKTNAGTVDALNSQSTAFLLVEDIGT